MGSQPFRIREARTSVKPDHQEEQMEWNLVGCARKGHVTYAPDEPELRDRLMAPTAAGTAWRCLRCGAFVSGGPHGGGPAAAAPLVRRGKELRSELILRVFAVERFLRFLVIGAAAYGVWRFKYDRAGFQRVYDNALPTIRALYGDLSFNVSQSRLLRLINESFAFDSRWLTLLAVGLALYALIELVESIGLWQGRRWGEYFAMVATSIFLPLEVWDLTRGHITWLKVGALVINLLLVIYLVWTKRLFGVCGGKAVYEARLRSESVIEVEQAALAAPAPGQAGPGTPADAALESAGDKPPGRGAAAAGPQTGAGPGRPRGHRLPGPAAVPAAAVDPASPAANADALAPAAGQQRGSR
jgi:uncharacterized membrane protein (DUF2068 family)